MAFPACVYFASFVEQINFFTQTHRWVFFPTDTVPSEAPLSPKVSYVSVSAALSACNQASILSIIIIIIKYDCNVTQISLRWVGWNYYMKRRVFKLQRGRKFGLLEKERQVATQERVLHCVCCTTLKGRKDLFIVVIQLLTRAFAGKIM